MYIQGVPLILQIQNRLYIYMCMYYTYMHIYKCTILINCVDFGFNHTAICRNRTVQDGEGVV